MSTKGPSLTMPFDDVMVSWSAMTDAVDLPFDGLIDNCLWANWINARNSQCISMEWSVVDALSAWDTSWENITLHAKIQNNLFRMH